jgi:uracil-DNA glycosylase family protein
MSTRVFGEGGPKPRAMFVGEQPGDQEDIQRRPFVGPAGKIFGKALVEAGIDRKQVYVTNAVKHFKWEPRGKRRIHKKPNSMEITACKPWIEAEIEVLHPDVIVCLGATASQSLLRRDFKVSTQRGVWIPSPLVS